MIKLIIRADDIGYSEAVNYGIQKAVRDGLVRSAGLMPNMPFAEHGYELLNGFDISIGQHTNVCLGRSCADPALIPSILDDKGEFKSSRAYREAFMKGEEIVVTEEAVIEVEAQYHKFLELVGKKPDYFEAHAVMSDNLAEALAIVTDKYDLPLMTLRFDGIPATFNGKPINILPLGSMSADYDAYECLKEGVLHHAREDMPNVAIMHPGYLDDYLLNHSSLTINRTKETAMLCDPAMREWLEEHNIELIQYSDLL